MKYAVHRPDGGVTILECGEGISPRDELNRRLPRAVVNERLSAISDPSFLARESRAASMYVASDDAVTIVSITDADIPTDRTFRDGWKLEGSKIGHDMVKCRDIHRERMRQSRVPKLAELDVEYQRADELGDSERKREIAREKQRLRDCTKHPDIESAATVDDLKKVWPL